MSVTKAVYQLLSEDEYLQAQLAEYNGSPAVFTQFPLPRGFDINNDWPYIITEGNVADNTDGSSASKNATGRGILRDIRIYQHVDGGIQSLEEIALHVWEMFHRIKLDVDGYDTVSTTASGPTLAPTEGDKIRGRVITLDINLYRSD